MTQHDIDAIAEAVVARLLGISQQQTEIQQEVSLSREEIKMRSRTRVLQAKTLMNKKQA